MWTRTLSSGPRTKWCWTTWSSRAWTPRAPPSWQEVISKNIYLSSTSSTFGNFEMAIITIFYCALSPIVGTNVIDNVQPLHRRRNQGPPGERAAVQQGGAQHDPQVRSRGSLQGRGRGTYNFICQCFGSVYVFFTDPDPDFFPNTDPNPDLFPIRIRIQEKKHQGNNKHFRGKFLFSTKKSRHFI